MKTNPRITVDPYTSNSGDIMKAKCEKINNSIDYELAHTYRLEILSQHNLPYVNRQSQLCSLAESETHDDASHKYMIVLTDKVKAQDADRLDTCDLPLLQPLSQCERQHMQALSSLNSQSMSQQT